MRGIPVSFPEPVAVSTSNDLSNARQTARLISRTTSEPEILLEVPAGTVWFIDHLFFQMVNGAIEVLGSDRIPSIYVTRADQRLLQIYFGSFDAMTSMIANLGDYENDDLGQSNRADGGVEFYLTRKLWRGPYLSGDKISCNCGAIKVGDVMTVNAVITEVRS